MDRFAHLPKGTVITASFTQGRAPIFTGTITRVNLEEPNKPLYVVECMGRGEIGGVRWFFPVEIITANGLNREEYIREYGEYVEPPPRRERRLRVNAAGLLELDPAHLVHMPPNPQVVREDEDYGDDEYNEDEDDNEDDNDGDEGGEEYHADEDDDGF